MAGEIREATSSVEETLKPPLARMGLLNDELFEEDEVEAEELSREDLSSTRLSSAMDFFLEAPLIRSSLLRETEIGTT